MTNEELVEVSLQKRIILCEENINDACASRMRTQFIKLNASSHAKPIRIYIDTRSGSSSEVLRIIDDMNIIDATIIGLAGGRCETLGLAILQACNERYALPNCEFTLTKLSAELSIGTDEKNDRKAMRDQQRRVLSSQKRIDTAILKGQKHNTHSKTPRTLRSRLERAYKLKQFVAEDALKMCFIDSIMTEPGFWKGDQILKKQTIGFVGH